MHCSMHVRGISGSSLLARALGSPKTTEGAEELPAPAGTEVQE